MATRIAVRRVLSIAKSRGDYLQGLQQTLRGVNAPLSRRSRAFLQDFELSSQRRLRGHFAMGESLMPMHSATAAASLVSKLQSGNEPLEGMFEGYLSPI
ncbi:hypothetical protein KP509_26G044300 [Ceratopteris richardii]|uniref:Uncharacterized protein n=1 Tax=Ceratopteris richardii TaxID=49495 RepID=A0A8T2RM65_CERRI|nr:hypothetical protein KP509_26G044300 [Ceratopteris richardii]